MPCDQAGKLSTGGCNLAYRGLTFTHLYCASWIIGGAEEQSITITVARKGIFALLIDWADLFEEVIDWLQFTYTAERTGAYVAPSSTVFVQYMVVEGDGLFPTFLPHLQKLYTGAYAPSTLGTRPDQSVAPASRAPECRESTRGEDGGEGLGNLISSSFSELGTSDLGRIRNLGPIVARTNNLIPNLTTVS